MLRLFTVFLLCFIALQGYSFNTGLHQIGEAESTYEYDRTESHYYGVLFKVFAESNYPFPQYSSMDDGQNFNSTYTLEFNYCYYFQSNQAYGFGLGLSYLKNQSYHHKFGYGGYLFDKEISQSNLYVLASGFFRYGKTFFGEVAAELDFPVTFGKTRYTTYSGRERTLGPAVLGCISLGLGWDLLSNASHSITWKFSFGLDPLWNLEKYQHRLTIMVGYAFHTNVKVINKTIYKD